MKNIWILLVLAWFIQSVHAQLDNSKNYFQLSVKQDSSGTHSLDVVTYYDGFGREEETVQRRVTPSGNDLFVHYRYDAMGRKERETTPDVSSLNGGFATPEYGDGKYTDYVYNEATGRLTRQTGAGSEWKSANKGMSYEYLGSDETIYKYTSVNNRLVKSGTYSAGTLLCEKVTDEDLHVSYKYTDKLGKTVLTRQVNDSGQMQDTYYVYDIYQRLGFVLPPFAVDALNRNGTYSVNSSYPLQAYAYCYQYDAWDHCVWKKFPGVEPVYFVYDKADNLIFSQNGLLRKRGLWEFTTYDNFNRVIMTGVTPIFVSREELAENMKNSLFRAPYINTCPSNLGEPGNCFGYQEYFANDGHTQILSVHYYDTYNFLSLECFRRYDLEYVENLSFGHKYEHTKGMLTGTYIRQLDDLGKGELCAFYYDRNGCEIQRKSILPPYGHRNTTWTKYNFTGQPLCVKKEHRSGNFNYPYPPGDPRGHNHQDELYDYEYDPAGRLSKLYHTHNGSERVLLSESVYDELGRLHEKYRHDGLDTIAYNYNVRNWVTSIRSRGFTEELCYNSNLPADASPLYTGNISAIRYRQKGQEYYYLFDYDKLGRLWSANSYTNAGHNHYYDEIYVYDKMGNITRLLRGSGPQRYEDLDIKYSGNQITSVDLLHEDSGSNYGSMSYPDLANQSVEYFYDENGNLTKNLDKGIVSIRYNLLNLPDTVQFANGNQIFNSYLADGRKIQSVYKTYTTGIVVPQDSVYHGDDPYVISIDEWNENYMYRRFSYTVNFVPEIFMIQTPEGYVGADRVGIDQSRHYSYYYYVHDHLGNIRINRHSMGIFSDQSLEYHPSGVLFERSREQGHQPYMYGGKELVSMHGLNWYDFSARMQDPVIPRFTTMDPMCELDYSVSPYAYCLNNPVNAIDPDGRLVIFVNGMHNGLEGASRTYWSMKGEKPIRFDMAVNAYFKDWNNKYYDGSIGGIMGLLIGGLSPFQRDRFGYITGEVDAASIIAGLSRNDKGEITETVKVIAHSMGAAYAKGLIRALVEYAKKNPGLCAGLSISEYDFAPFQTASQRGADGVSTFQYSHNRDDVAGDGRMRGARYMNTNSDKNQTHSIRSFYNQIRNLPAGKYEFVNGQFVKVD